ncbi:hypothetical protein GCM10007338_18880 [Corynebacterium pelargi]|nr:hypothetical protein GCM10007338_18880 [Corynebacterium pelargi]
MATALQAFTNHEFGTIRTITSGGQILFCGRAVATALGYANTNDALARHCKGPLINTPLRRLVTSSRSGSSARATCTG